VQVSTDRHAAKKTKQMKIKSTAKQCTAVSRPRLALTPIAYACAVACPLMFAQVQVHAQAQSDQPVSPKAMVSGTSAPIAVATIGEIDLSKNALVARVAVEVEKDGLPADGVGNNSITVKLFDAKDKPILVPIIITIETSAGRILLPGAKTDEMGPGRVDLDRATPGMQLKIVNGSGTFRLLSPFDPTDVKLRITAGSAVAEGTIAYMPELREMLAIGLIEGVISVKKKSASTIVPARIDDGFERELRHWTREFSNGKGTAGARVAFFLKGTVKGDMLVTMAADSDKDLKDRLYRDVDPNKFYPVYGDSSITGFDARSRDRLFVRLDKNKSYALYGDFSTGDGFSQLADGALVADVKSRNLGNYNRTATGLRGHYEQTNYFVNGFATYDSLKNLVEEYRTNGTSGPFSVASTQAIEGSEKIEIVTRDRNALDRVINIQPQLRLVDYTFEPFSGRVVFKAPVPSIDINGNPQSIRISYEAEQGGPKFATYGVDGQLKINTQLEVGASAVRDKNPLSPYQLDSVNLGIKLNERSSMVFEVARSKSTRWNSAGNLTATPSGELGELRDNLSGQALRVEGNYVSGAVDTKFWWLQADRGFYNPSASVSEGRTEAGLSGKFKWSDTLSLYAMGQQTTDGLQAAKPRRRSAALGLSWLVNDRLTLDASVRNSREDAGFTAASAFAGNASNGGGFFGGAFDPSNPTNPTNPTTGNAVLPLNASNIVANGLPNSNFANATTLRLGANYRVTDQFSVQGEIEGGSGSSSGSNATRFGLGAGYQINERSRAYARYEHTTGLTSSSSLNPNDRSNSFVAGIDNTFANGPTVFSEFRMRDAINAQLSAARDQQLATGVRNTWNVREGLAYTGSIEYLKILTGTTRDAFAIAGGVDHTQSETWKTSARLEYRRLFDDKATTVKDQQNQYLSTVSVAHKMNRDWSLLARNYLLYQDNSDNGKRTEDRFQIGAAWRPVDHNRWNALSRYEYKTVRDVGSSNPLAEDYSAHIVSLHADYHPSRPWWFNGRVAAKSTNDKTLPAGQQRYSAYLLGGRAVYDITENWDVGVMAAYMFSPSGSAKQKALGLEAGYLVRQNLWLSAGYNVTGFNDKDLVGTDYTNKGFYIRLRFKFDENLFAGKNKDINRTLDR
jgi:hypothetical protein